MRAVVSALEGARVRLVTALTLFFTGIARIWSGWPGSLLRCTGAFVLLSTLVTNALIVPYANNRLLPRLEEAASSVTGRPVTIEGIRWVRNPLQVVDSLRRAGRLQKKVATFCNSSSASSDSVMPLHLPFELSFSGTRIYATLASTVKTRETAPQHVC